MDNIVIQTFLQSIHLQQFGCLVFFMAFLGGVISSVSPCTLGLLPIVVGYIGGYSEEKNTKTVVQILFFIFGLSLTLTILGITSALTGRVLGAFSGPGGY